MIQHARLDQSDDGAAAAPENGAKASIADATAGGRRDASAIDISEAVLESVFVHGFDGIVTADQTGCIEAFNPAAESIFGYRASEVLGRNVSMLMQEEQASTHAGYIDSYLHGRAAGKVGKGPRELMARRSNGEAFPIDIAITEVHTGPGRRFIAIIRDIGERKARDRALQTALEEAEQATERERKASQVKVNFLSSLTHELRTPLNAILGFSEMIQDGTLTPSATRKQEYARLIHSAGTQLLELVNNLLELARMESPRLASRPEPLSPRTFFSEIEAHWRPLITYRKIGLVIDLDPAIPERVVADYRCLQHVFTNLLANALKFTEKGYISVQLSVTTGDHAQMLLQGEVRDTGIGVSAENADLIFQPFTQLDEGMARRYDGAGLGLAICRRLCETAGGTIDVHANSPGGSVFRFRIPAYNMVSSCEGSADGPRKGPFQED